MMTILGSSCAGHKHAPSVKSRKHRMKSCDCPSFGMIVDADLFLKTVI